MALPATMAAVLLTRHGGLDVLEYRTDVPVPVPGRGEVLIRVAAAGVNNTDINTRSGWYSKRVTDGTDPGGADAADAGWSGAPLSFPRIQGADVCGHIAAAGPGVDPVRIGERVIVRNMLRSHVGYRPWACWTLGSDCDGGFAQFVKAPAAETFAVRCDWSDAELASVPCAWSTAENMLHRIGLGPERVLVTGASGGVGSAAVQLAKARGATVIAVAGRAKAGEVRALGADWVIARGADPVAELGPGSVDAVVDVVGGAGTARRLDLLARGGRYAVAGAIAGPMAEVDLRTIYLRDLSVFGCTFQPDEVFANFVAIIEAGAVRPVVARTYPLHRIAEAQADFMAKTHTGKLVLVPPQETAA